MGQLLVDPAGAQGNALKDLLTKLEDLVENLLKLANAAANAFFTLLTAVVEATTATWAVASTSWSERSTATAFSPN